MTNEAYSSSNNNNLWGITMDSIANQSIFQYSALLYSSGEHCGVIVHVLQSACWKEMFSGSTTYESHNPGQAP